MNNPDRKWSISKNLPACPYALCTTKAKSIVTHINSRFVIFLLLLLRPTARW